ncbi:MAG: hypothetical protein HY944_04685 [Gemmatimonadetes bacterium]|nr:hypothetical protein [Gemmatimonadota bacterium]
MYSSCLFCHADLGRNEAVEHFPVGRRLAFDTANGRFWVICQSCKRWNLSPLEERWDAMDECERLYERTRLRMSTDNIGLARIAEGTELVRVGPALRPEMAAWRFGEQLAARRRSYRWLVAGGVVASAGLFIGVKTAGVGFVAGNWAWDLVKGAYERATRIVLPLPAERTPASHAIVRPKVQVGLAEAIAGKAPTVETKHAQGAIIMPGAADGAFGLEVPIVGRAKIRYGAEAVSRVLPKLLAKVNRSGGKKDDERVAVEMLERVAGDRVPDLYTGLVQEWGHTSLIAKPLKDYGWRTLALEMALQEQRERELLAGELLELEFAWKEAEELARIADTLTTTRIDQALARLKARIDR